MLAMADALRLRKRSDETSMPWQKEPEAALQAVAFWKEGYLALRSLRGTKVCVTSKACAKQASGVRGAH
jgi:hypothetical protein